MISLINGLIWFGIFQAFFLGFILLSKASKIQASIFLSIILFVEAIGLLEQSLYFSDLIRNYPYILGVSYPLAILRPLLIYLFVKAYFLNSIQFRKRDILHLIPFFMSLIVFLPLILLSPEEKMNYIDSIKGRVWSDNIEGILFFVVNNIIYLGYYLFTWRILHTVKPLLRLEKSRQSLWVANFITFFLWFFVLKFILYLLNGFHLLSTELFGTIVMLISSFTIQIIAWFLTSSSKLPTFNPSNPALKEELGILKRVLEHDKAYLDDSLTVKKLATLCDMRPERISEIIRINYQETFKEVVNKLRIHEAKKLIASDLNGRPLNLLGIAMEAGFNNKVTFYRAFKKATGLAPSDYVKKLKSRP